MKYTRKLLSDDCLEQITSLLDHITWVDGTVSGGGPRKKNLQADRDCPALHKIDMMVYDHISKDEEFAARITPKETQRALVSKTEVGGYYKAHTDIGYLGHYSTTVFLNDDYEGGELELYYDDTVHSVKLPAGHAVTYKTGIPHTVKPVISGTRYVAVTWTTSTFKHDLHREICYDLWRAYKDMPEKVHNTLGEWNDDPRDILMSLEQKIYREYGQF